MTGKILVACLLTAIGTSNRLKNYMGTKTAQECLHMKTDSQKVVRYIAILYINGQKKVYGDKEPASLPSSDQKNKLFEPDKNDPSEKLFDSNYYLTIRDENNNVRRYRTMEDVPQDDIARIKLLQVNESKLLQKGSLLTRQSGNIAGSSLTSTNPLQYSANSIRNLVRDLENEKIIAPGSTFKLSSDGSNIILNDLTLKGSQSENFIAQLKRLQISSMERDSMGNISYKQIR